MLDGIKKAVFFACHTDDEMVCAGTLHRLVRQGVEVQVVTFAPAAIETDRTGTQESVKVVTREWNRSLNLIGVDPHKRFFYAMTPSADLHPYRQIICQSIFDFCEEERPDAVFTLSPDDENTAHAIVGIESERVLRGRVPLAIRCQFPWNLSYGRGNLFVSLTAEDMECKRRVIAAYESQAFRYRYGEMLLHQAYSDGMSVKVEAAEKFEIIRAVV